MERSDIQDFNSIRSVLRHIYRYGFHSRDDFISHGLIGNARSYDSIIRRLKDLYYYDSSSDSMDIKLNQKKKSFRFRRDYFDSSPHRLLAIYGFHSININSICDIVCCMSCANNFKGLSTGDIITVRDMIGKRSPEKPRDNKSAISRRLNSMSNYGYLSKGTPYGKLYYHSANSLDKISDDDLVGLYYLADFFSSAGSIKSASAFLRSAISRQLIYRGIESLAPVFLFRDEAYGNIFDEPIVFFLLECCRSHKIVCLQYNKRENEKIKILVKPVFLRYDTRLGRWYLFAINDKNPSIYRVDKIDSLSETNQHFDYSSAKKEVDSWAKYRHLSVPNKRKKGTLPILIEAELLFDDSESVIRAQFEREILIGKIECGTDNIEYYRAITNDPKELKPFLRSYGAYLRIVPSEHHNLAQEIRDEYERMWKTYGAIQ